MKTIQKLAAGLLGLVIAAGAVGPAAQELSPESVSAASYSTQDELNKLYNVTIRNLVLTGYDLNADKGIETAYFTASTRYPGYPDIKQSCAFRIAPETAYKDSSAADPEETAAIQHKAFDLLRQLPIGSYVSLNVRTASPQSVSVIENLGSLSEMTITELVSVRQKGIHYYGDANDDGFVDTFDIITMRNYLAGTLSYELSKDQIANADINYSGDIDEDDLRQVTEYVLGSVSQFNGAGEIGSVRLEASADVQSSEGKAADEVFAASQMNLAVELLRNASKTQEQNKNILISPLSITAALSMTANGADGETRDEMEQVLGSGIKLDDLNEYLAWYLNNLPDGQMEKLRAANSIWIKDIPSFKVLDSFLETNQRYYSSEIYKAAFDKSTAKDINSWVNRNTDGMIPQMLKENIFDENKDILMTLVNTLFFEADWKTPYSNSYDSKFTGINGEKTDIKAMSSREYLYYELDNADAFKKPYAGRYSFVGILPHEDLDLYDFIDGLDAAELTEALSDPYDPSKLLLHAMIPKFSYNYELDLNDILTDMGMGSAFKGSADFSKINDLSVPGAQPLMINSVLHKTRIEMTEKGTRAAAATSVSMAAGSAAPTDQKIVDIILNRPFVYMIVDENNIPVFIGAATNIES